MPELIINGGAVFQGANLAAASVIVNGDSSIEVDITTTGDLGQNYTGAVEISSNIHLNAYGANPVVLGNAGATGRISGNDYNLTITGSATLNGTDSNSDLGMLAINGSAIFNTAYIIAQSVNVTGDTTMDMGP